MAAARTLRIIVAKDCCTHGAHDNITNDRCTHAAHDNVANDRCTHAAHENSEWPLYPRRKTEADPAGPHEDYSAVRTLRMKITNGRCAPAGKQKPTPQDHMKIIAKPLNL